MKSWIYLIAASLALSTSAHAAQTFRPLTHKLLPEKQGPKLRILLEEDVNSALIEVKGAYRVVDKSNGAILSRGPFGKRYVFHAISNGLRWGEEYPDSYHIVIKPMTKESSLYVNGIQYKGSITVYQTTKNRISVVNEIPIEDLLVSLLSAKYGVPLAHEAMAAATILERTKIYLLHEKGKNEVTFDCTKEDIGYYGYGITKQFVGIEEVVEGTRFMVVEGLRKEQLATDVAQLEELARKGWDAKQILSSYGNMGLTTKIPSKIIR